jgi:hypothetical protein
MRLRIQLLRQGEAVKNRLQHDGWKLKAESSDTLSAWHAAVGSEAAARRRLHGLGLLTSATLRVEFELDASRAGSSGKAVADQVGSNRTTGPQAVQTG